MVYKLAASILHKHIMMPTSVMYKEGSGVQYFWRRWDPTWANPLYSGQYFQEFLSKN